MFNWKTLGANSHIQYFGLFSQIQTAIPPIPLSKLCYKMIYYKIEHRDISRDTGMRGNFVPESKPAPNQKLYRA